MSAFYSVLHVPREAHGALFARIAAWLLEAAGFTLEVDETVTMREPEGSATFHWVLGRR